MTNQYQNVLMSFYQRTSELALIDVWLRVMDGSLECGWIEMAALSGLVELSKHDTLCIVGRMVKLERRWSGV